MTTACNAWNNEDNRESAIAYIEARIDQFVERHEHAVSAEVKSYQTKTGNNKLKLIVTCDDTHGRVNVELGSTFALDWDRVDPKFEKNHDALIVKERETHKGAKPARKPVAGSRKAIETENAELKAQIAAMQAAMVAAGLIAA